MNDPEAVLTELRSHEHPSPKQIAAAAEAVVATLDCDRGLVVCAIMGDLASAEQIFYQRHPGWAFRIKKDHHYVASFQTKNQCFGDDCPTDYSWVIGLGGNGPAALLAAMVRVKLLQNEDIP